MEAVLRFLAVTIITASFAIWDGLPLVLSAILTLSIGLAAAVWGDKVIVGFVSVVRHLIILL
jgi:hypothetical protein